MVLIDEPKHQITLATTPPMWDGLNYLEGRTMAFINEKAFEGTVLAHNDGGVPNVVLHVSDFSEDSLGQLIYFFEKACAISGYLLGVNPFDQPGVESYKKNMFALLGKPATRMPRPLWRSACPAEAESKTHPPLPWGGIIK